MACVSRESEHIKFSFESAVDIISFPFTTFFAQKIFTFIFGRKFHFDRPCTMYMCFRSCSCCNTSFTFGSHWTCKCHRNMNVFYRFYSAFRALFKSGYGQTPLEPSHYIHTNIHARRAHMQLPFLNFILWAILSRVVQHNIYKIDRIITETIVPICIYMNSEIHTTYLCIRQCSPNTSRSRILEVLIDKINCSKRTNNIESSQNIYN